MSDIEQYVYQVLTIWLLFSFANVLNLIFFDEFKANTNKWLFYIYYILLGPVIDIIELLKLIKIEYPYKLILLIIPKKLFNSYIRVING